MEGKSHSEICVVWFRLELAGFYTNLNMISEYEISLFILSCFFPVSLFPMSFDPLGNLLSLEVMALVYITFFFIYTKGFLYYRLSSFEMLVLE